MAYKDILLQMDDTPQCQARLEVAIKLAQQHKGALTGLYVITHPHYAPESEAAKERAREAEKLFIEKTIKAGVEAVWQCVDWQVSGVSASEVFCLRAYYADLVVIGQPDPSAVEGSATEFPERLVLGCGRPVLVMPYSAQFDSVGDRIMVAWRGGRESVRVTNDAIPFLRRGDLVQLCTIVSAEEEPEMSAETCVKMCDHLGHHGVKAESRVLTVTVGEVGDALLNEVFEEGMDLIVVGAFDPRGRGPHAVGSVARHLLRNASVPLLLSH